ncbi:MAG: hypothetical protein HND51_16475 [Chloroflexi bacterium]|nr:hypothetical protein [Chloroflexota bacterium]
MEKYEFPLEYEYQPSLESEERLAQAWELIFALILEDYQQEQMQALGETC